MDAYEFMEAEPESIPEYQAKQIAYQLIRSINYLGQNGILHNDIKLENFLLELPISDEIGSTDIKQ